MSLRLLTDSEIQQLRAEKKVLPITWASRLKTRPKAETKFQHREFSVTGANNHEFRIIIRQNSENILDFSIILTFVDKDGSEYRLLRFNGKHPSEHTNKWERDTRAKGTHLLCCDPFSLRLSLASRGKVFGGFRQPSPSGFG